MNLQTDNPKLTRFAWIRERIDHDGDDCLLWPFAHDQKGYGLLSVKTGQNPQKAHRVMCVLVHGQPPSPAHQAAHLCGNHSCVNPKHVEWKTQSENEMDKRLHGRAHFSGQKNRYGLNGVTFRKNRWVTQIRIDKKQIYLGSFVTKAAAIERYNVNAIAASVAGKIYPINRPVCSCAVTAREC